MIRPTPLPRPTPAQLKAAKNTTVTDVIRRDLDVLFCGINPSVYSAAVGHHFARPGNRFWPAMFAGGFTGRLLSPAEDRELLDSGCGVTNVVDRATVAADELSADDLRAGAVALAAKVRRLRPRYLAILGVGAYRTGFGRAGAALGLQPEAIGRTRIWVLPNPSGLNAHYKPADLGRLFREFRMAVVSLPSFIPSSGTLGEGEEGGVIHR